MTFKDSVKSVFGDQKKGLVVYVGFWIDKWRVTSICRPITNLKQNSNSSLSYSDIDNLKVPDSLLIQTHQFPLVGRYRCGKLSYIKLDHEKG